MFEDDIVGVLLLMFFTLIIITVCSIIQCISIGEVKTELKNINIPEYIIEQERIKMVLTPEQKALLGYCEDK